MEDAEEDDAIGLDTYGYPQVSIWKDACRITFGWFFTNDENENEPASYAEVVIDKDGNALYTIDVQMGFLFNFKTKLRDYGTWIHPPLEDEKRGAKPYWIYADHHVDFKVRARHWIHNLPWKIKRKIYIKISHRLWNLKYEIRRKIKK